MAVETCAVITGDEKEASTINLMGSLYVYCQRPKRLKRAKMSGTNQILTSICINEREEAERREKDRKRAEKGWKKGQVRPTEVEND